MSQEILGNGDSGLEARVKINNNFSELYQADVEASAALLAALPAPLAIAEGRVYSVPENQQVAFRFPIAVDGVLRVDGILYEV